MPRQDSRPHVLMSWFMDDWGRFGRAYEEIARQLAQSEQIARVLCLLPAEWTPMTRWQWPLLVREHREKLTAITLRPHCAPGRIQPYRLRRILNHWLPHKLPIVVSRVRGFSPENTLLWLFPAHSLAEQLHGTVARRATLLHVIDNNAMVDTNRPEQRASIAGQYRRLARAADWVYVNSDYNRDIFSPFNRNTYCFRNAVDPVFFGIPREQSGTVKLGYLGWVTQRTDVAILEHIAAARPDWQLLIAAPATVQARERLRTLSARRNVVWMNDVDHAAAPDFLASLDVCLMPHVESAYSKSMHPLKLLQYLASSRPIVTTGVAGVEQWSEHLRIASDGPGFVRAIEETLLHDTRAAAHRRVEAVRSETWELRVRSMLEPILAGWADRPSLNAVAGANRYRIAQPGALALQSNHPRRMRSPAGSCSGCEAIEARRRSPRISISNPDAADASDAGT
jgi:glycosyltransferase involved in cell wall biosynthesis